METFIVGRNQEQKELERAYASNEAEFIAVYGRRRVGKTFLIKNYYRQKDCVFFHVTGIKDATANVQLEQFTKMLGEVFYNGASIEVPKNWMGALEELTKAINSTPSERKIILFFDEFPWMAARRSGLKQALDYFWNRYWVDIAKINLIICGSSSSWIINKIVKDRGGLHNRITRKIVLKPFSITEVEVFLKYRGIKLTKEQILQLYMVLGGVPHYLKHIEKGLSAAENISKLCFNKNGLLFSEFDEVFSSLFEDHEAYKELISIANSARQGTSRKQIEKSNKLTGKGGRLTQRLRELEDSGFIASFVPVGHKQKGLYYRVVDEYCCFYLAWMQAEQKTLAKEENNADYWMMVIGTPKYNSWVGYAFEAFCYKHLSSIRHALKINARATAGTWRHRPKKGGEDSGAQIDLMFDRDDNAVTICEIKYSNQPFVVDKEYYHNLLNKIKVYKKETGCRKQFFVAMIANAGLKKTVYSEEIVTGLVTLNDFFKSSREHQNAFLS
ncbi:MAG: ATP-binding protein [Gammaproteobacteria bacterium]